MTPDPNLDDTLLQQLAGDQHFQDLLKQRSIQQALTPAEQAKLFQSFQNGYGISPAAIPLTIWAPNTTAGTSANGVVWQPGQAIGNTQPYRYAGFDPSSVSMGAVAPPCVEVQLLDRSIRRMEAAVRELSKHPSPRGRVKRFHLGPWIWPTDPAMKLGSYNAQQTVGP